MTHELRSRLVFSCLAAMLLAAQLVLTSAHVHRPAASGAQGIPLATAPSADAGDAPVQPEHDADHCPICWAYHAGGISLIPPAYALPLPAGFTALAFPATSHDLLPSTAARAFRPRGPPHGAAA